MDKKRINKKIYFAVIIIMAVLAFLNINANASTIQTKDIENISNKAYEQFKKGIETNTIIENNNKTLIGHHPITGGVLFKTDWIDYFRINANGKAWKE